LSRRAKVRQGDVWLADLNPTTGREQAGTRPVLVISVDALNNGPSDLAIVVPITSTKRPNPIHVELGEGVGGLRSRSFALPEMVSSISRERLCKRWGTVAIADLLRVVERVRILTRVS
jgi:mRNA interferase MazF